MKFKKLLSILLSVIFVACIVSCDTDDCHYIRQENPASKRNYIMTDGKSATIVSKYNADYDIIIRFAKVLKNNIYSIDKVFLAANSDEQLSTYIDANKHTLCKQKNTDIIGPIMVKRPISGDSWVGGNHLYLNQESGIKSAATNSFSIYADGTLVEQGAVYADVVTIDVENTIFDPDVAPLNGERILSSPLIAENISYSISGGEILVNVEHCYLKDVHVGVYYGMQSAFKGTKFITTQGGYYDWEKNPEDKDILNIKKADVPNFNRFSQRSSNNIYYQNSILLPCGLGTHDYINDSSNIFINSGKKAYHVLIDDKKIAKGTMLSWKGIYNWRKPIVDDEYNYIYEYYNDGRKYISVTAKKPYESISIPAPEGSKDGIFHTTESDDNISIDNTIANIVKLSAKGKGSICGFFTPKRE